MNINSVKILYFTTKPDFSPHVHAHTHTKYSPNAFTVCCLTKRFHLTALQRQILSNKDDDIAAVAAMEAAVAASD